MMLDDCMLRKIMKRQQAYKRAEQPQGMNPPALLRRVSRAVWDCLDGARLNTSMAFTSAANI